MTILEIPRHECLSDFNEKQLKVEIQDIQHLELILGAPGDAECLVWLPQREAFLSNVSQFGSSVHIEGYQGPTMEVEWSEERSERFSYWHVHASSLALERQIVAHLVTVPDASGFTSLSVNSMFDEEEEKHDLFPCSPDQIKKIFQNNVNRELHIHSFALDESQTVALVEVDLPLRIKLSSCEFLYRDGNEAWLCPFNEALQSRSNPIQSLCFGKNVPFTRNPFRQCQLEKFWSIVASKNLIDTLCLEEIAISKENGFGDMSSVPLKTLILRDCTFGLQGAGIEIIAELIHCGCVSEGLVWDGLDCHRGPSWCALACAIASCQLLEFRLANVSNKWEAPMMMGVLEMAERNTRLQHLSVGDIFNFSPDAWNCLMAAVSKHSSLQVLQVENFLDGIPHDFPAAALKSLTDMMRINRNIEVDVPLCRYKRKLGDDDPIEHLLNFNRFSRQVGKLGQIEDLYHRFALVGKSVIECRADFKKLSLLIAGHVDLLVPSFSDACQEGHCPSNKRARPC